MPKQILHIASKVRLYPSKDQDALFRKTLGCCRWIYNHYLALRLREYRRCKAAGCPADFVWRTPKSESKLKQKYPWLSEPLAQTLQQSHMDLDQAFKNYHQHGFGKPRFHRRGQKESFRVPQWCETYGNWLWLPKYGWAKFRGSTLPKGVLKSVTVSLDAGKWYASILHEVSAKDYYQSLKFSREAIGIDLGIVQPLTVTDGKRFKTLGVKEKQRLELLEKRRKRYQRMMARKKKGSSNRWKARQRVAKAFQKEKFYRKNFQHQVSNWLTKQAPVVVFEDLKLSNMTKRTHNKGVAAKSGLNREMLRLGLGKIVSLCQYKAARRGGEVRFADPKFTSQTCSSCGCINRESRKSQSSFECVECGFELNADKNAALNILARAA